MILKIIKKVLINDDLFNYHVMVLVSKDSFLALMLLFYPLLGLDVSTTQHKI